LLLLVAELEQVLVVLAAAAVLVVLGQAIQELLLH
jgi:hypothetical protein